MLAPPRIPLEVTAHVRAELAEQSPAEVQMFFARLERWWPDLSSAIAAVYPDPERVCAELAVHAARGFAVRDEALKQRDLERILRPDWFQDPAMIGYAAYTERFAPDGLAGVADHVDHLQALGVSYLHLMPLLEPRPAPNDGGYAVADYRRVRPDLGTMDDLRALATRLHESGLSLCLDLVLNHVADEHEWARRARAGEQPYQDYFYVFGDRTMPDLYEQTLPEVFPDFAPGNFTRVGFTDPSAGEVDRWVWTTFNDYQWDLNWSNPEVLAEMVDVVLFLANVGADILRLDAIAFIWKRLGTTSQNQPEVHAITQALRAVLRITAPAVVLLAEAIVAPSELTPYLGQGKHHGKVSDLAYHNSLMVQYWSMIASRDTSLAVRALEEIASIPPSTAWLTYLRCHDDIGWAVMDEDAAAVGISGFGHRSFLSEFYSGSFPGSFANGMSFQDNPETGDTRISGTAASLCGLDAAIEANDVPAATDAVARIVLGYALMAFWGGIPVIWSGDELAMRNDPTWANEPGHASDNRWVHRPRIDWRLARQVAASEPLTAPTGGSVISAWPGNRVDEESAARVCWQGLRRVLQTRAQLPQLSAATRSHAVSTPDRAIFAARREHPLGVALALFNVSESPRSVSLGWFRDHGVEPTDAVDALTGAGITQDALGNLALPPYGCVWLTNNDVI